MTNFDFLRAQKIGIFGLGRTGIATYLALKDHANSVICYDDNDNNRLEFARKYGKEQLVNFNEPIWQNLTQIILSPGVPLWHNIVSMTKSHNITISSDIDILYQICQKAKFIAVTGTNGKSTTTNLIHHILQTCNYDYELGGNIGHAALSLDFNKKGYVLELSSFQLDLIAKFRADVSVLLNITPDHLDRHKNMENYISAKRKIFLGLQKSLENNKFGVINVDNKITKKIFTEFTATNPSLKSNLIPISAYQIQANGIAVLPDNTNDDKEQQHIIYDNINNKLAINLSFNPFLQGEHNRENIAAGYAACRAIDLPPADIAQAINTYTGLPHRMQYVGTSGNVRFYNDSKATNSQAASMAIRALDNIYWLAGGIAKEDKLEQIKPWMHKITKAYLFGRDKEIFAAELNNIVPYTIYNDLKSAFQAAYPDARNSKRVSNILLSPAAASQDQFKDFNERGNLFIELFTQAIK